MPHLDHIIVADGITPRQDGKIDIYGAAWDTIYARAVPAVHPQIAIALRVMVSAQEAESPHKVDIVLMPPDGPELARVHGDIHPIPPEVRSTWPAGAHIGIGSILNFQNLVFPQFGQYHLSVLWDGSELRPPLVLKLEHTPEPQEPNEDESA